MGETTTDLDIIWDPANFSTGLWVLRAKTRGEGVGSLLLSLGSCSGAELCRNKGWPRSFHRGPLPRFHGSRDIKIFVSAGGANPPGEAAAPEMLSQQEVNKGLFRLTKDAHGTSPGSICHV